MVGRYECRVETYFYEVPRVGWKVAATTIQRIGKRTFMSTEFVPCGTKEKAERVAYLLRRGLYTGR